MFLGKAGSIGLEVLDILGSSITSFNSQSDFELNKALKESKVQILAFEVANTIVKGSILMQSLSEENIQILKMEILYSEGVQLLVSTDIKELLSIAAADMREEFKVFSREVVRFGNMCKDAQWHYLDRFFTRLDLDPMKNITITLGGNPLFSIKMPQPEKILRFKEMETTMQELTNLAQHTFELYHEYLALDRTEQLYQRKIEEEVSLRIPRKGKNLMILQNELKHQRKLVRNLKQKSLWSKRMAEIIEKLVDVVIFIHHAIAEAFEENVITARSSTSSASSTENVSEANENPERLGVAGLALHYANLITHMDIIASRSTCLPSNIRDTLYNGLPANVKAGLRSRLQRLYSEEVMTMPQVKAEMEKTLRWLVPLATHTTKAHQGFGWVGEWANTGNEFGQKTISSNNIIRLQTLYHADKQKMDGYILDLIIYLHRLISIVRYLDKVPKYAHARSPPTSIGHPTRVEILSEDKKLLEEVTKRTLVHGVSKSQELVMVKKRNESFCVE